MNAQFSRLVLHVAVAAVAAMLATVVAAMGYLATTGPVTPKVELIRFAIVISLGLMPIALPLSVIVGMVHAVLVDRRWAGRGIIAEILAAVAGAVLGVGATHHAPHVSLSFAVKACTLAWTGVALVVVLIASRRSENVAA
jgi:hypothetical protein